MTCTCSSLCFASDIDLAALKRGRHHQACPNYKDEKYPRLMYYEEAIDAWTLAPDKVDGELICTADQLEEGDTLEIMFKRVDMTDFELDSLPED